MLFGPQPIHPIPSPGSVTGDPKPLFYVTAIVICVLVAWVADTLVTAGPSAPPVAKKVELTVDESKEPYRSAAGKTEKAAPNVDAKPKVPHFVFYIGAVVASIIVNWMIHEH